MVGIPGKSSGCHTCRRRKIKCDLAQPSCGNCMRSNRPCEGYARRATFLNRTLQGLMKRKPMEEILLPPVSASTSQLDQLVAPVSATENVTRPRSLSESIQYHGSQQPEIFTRQRLIEQQFLEMYLAKENTVEWPSPGTYVSAVLALRPREHVLDYSIKALTFCKIGRTTASPDLVKQGVAAHVQALEALRSALTDPALMLSDHTLAATKILNLHELYEPSETRSKIGLQGHNLGSATLAHLRGNRKDDSKVARLLLEASRCNSMISALQIWRDPIFAQSEWRISTPTTIGDFAQALYDIGFDLAYLRHELHNQGTIAEGSPEKQNLVQRYIQIESDLSTWYAKFIEAIPKPAYWPDLERPQPQDALSAPLTFAHLGIAHILIDYWALNILAKVLVPSLTHLLTLHQSSSNSLVDPPISEEQRLFIDQITNINSTIPACISLINLIESSLPYCLLPEMGLVGPQRTLLAVRVCLAFYRALQNAQNAQEQLPSSSDTLYITQANAEVQRFVNILLELKTRYGICYAEDLAKEPFPGFLPTWAGFKFEVG